MSKSTTGRRVGTALVAGAALLAIAAPIVAPHGGDENFVGLLNAPPTQIHFRDDSGGWRAPFIYPWRRVSQLEQRYEEDRTRPVALEWFEEGHLVRSGNETLAPLLVLGADSFGRDVFSRLSYGARLSLGLSLAAALGAVLLGALVGGVSGYTGGMADDILMRASDFVMVLPAMYVALALRSMLPLVLAPGAVFLLLTAIFAVVGAPFIARGVRAIIRSERQRDYAVAAESLGAGRTRLLLRHLLPAARGFIAVQLTMLVPAFIVAEATLSYVGLGFGDEVASWGTMLQEASTLRAFADFPWLLSPAAAMFLVVLGLNLVLQEGRKNPSYAARLQ
jgi:peptide/nickel transport system permease protein